MSFGRYTISPYIANLNTIRTDLDASSSPSSSPYDDFSVFTGSEFFDWDLGTTTTSSTATGTAPVNKPHRKGDEEEISFPEEPAQLDPFSTTTSHPSAQSSNEVAAVGGEDKRRRNTAASARFRVKKKQRDQAMEKTARDMTERVRVLEGEVGQLRMENEFLRGLVTEKERNGRDIPKAKGLENGQQGEMIDGKVKRGVGTV